MQTMASEWIEEGEIQGRLKEKREIILHLLQYRFHPSAESIEQLQRQLARISDVSVLNKLRDLSLDANDLSEFFLRLQGVLPKRAVVASPDELGVDGRFDLPIAETVTEK